ncbi:MAG: hypothetical protein MUC36_01520 [Planctomycetes bacterium]|nr:hypothetical protein [Planctomycetota bacterium]
METETRPANQTGRTLLPVMLAGIWRHRGWVIAAMMVGGAFGVFRAVVTPSQYRSSGKLFVRPGVRENMQPDAAFAGGGSNASRMSGSREAILTEMQVLSSPDLFDLVVEDIGPDEILAPFEPPPAGPGGTSWHAGLMHSFQRWWFGSGEVPGQGDKEQRFRAASALLFRTVIIVPEAGTSVITVYYVSSSPERARTVVDGVLEAAQKKHQITFEGMSGVAKVEDELRTNEKLAVEAETALREFKRDKGIYDFHSQQGALQSYLSDLDRQIDTIDLDTKRRLSEKQALDLMLPKIPPERIAPGSDSFVVNPDYEMFSQQLNHLRESDLALEYARNVTISGPAYENRKRDLAGRIAILEARLETEKKQIKLDGSIEKNPEYARVESRLADIEVELKGLESQRTQVDNLRKSQRKAFESLEALAPSFRELDLDAKQKRATADRLAEHVFNMKAVQRLEQLNLSNIQVMQSGSLEPDKIAPRRTWLVTIGVFFGAAFGLAMTALWSLFDSKVRIAADVKRLGIPPHQTLIGRVDSDAPGPGSRVPVAFADLRSDIAHFWAALPYERGTKDGLKIACLACGDAMAGRATAAMALGLAIHGGERVAHVTTSPSASWLAVRLGLSPRRGWSEVVAGKARAADVATPTAVAGLDHFGIGEWRGEGAPVPGPAFLEFLAELSRSYRFVVIELPDLEIDPSGRSVLGAIDGVQLVVRSARCRKGDFRRAMLAVAASGCRLLGCILQPETGVENKPAKVASS